MLTLCRALRCVSFSRQQCHRINFSSAGKPVTMSFDVVETASQSSAPLIIMHGLFGSKQNWRGISRALESKLKKTVFAVDARNHGDSPHTADHSSEHMAEDVVDFIRTKGFNKACVMGHSMGGRTMMYMALKYPELVHCAIIVDISPISLPRDFTQMNQIFTAMKNVNIPSDMSMAQGRVLAEQQMKEAVKDKDTINFIMLNLRKRNTGEFYWTHNVDGLQINLTSFSGFTEHIAHLPPFKGPIMFICGSRSNFMKPEHWPQIQKIFPNSEIHWLDAGHLVHFEKPAEFIDLILKFIAKNE